MISCHDALRLVHEYLDGELDGVPQAEVKAHFDMCEKCYPHLHLESTFRDAVRRAARAETAPPELRARLAQLFAEADSEG
jgi:anti-sigma factor (TIGR02949 family)